LVRMTDARTFTSAQNLPRTLGAVGLVAVALVLAVFTTPMVVQTFRGPRPVTEQDLQAIEEPGWWDNYVSFTPARPALDTGVRYGVKGNPGTKYILLPVASRSLFCSMGVRAEGPEYVGWLGTLNGPE